MQQNKFQHAKLPSNLSESIKDKQQDLEYLDFQCLRKKIKRQSNICQQNEYQNHQIFQFDQQYSQNQQQKNNIFKQQFDNLRACSFKTISKIALQKNMLTYKMENQDIQPNSATLSKLFNSKSSNCNKSEEIIQNLKKKQSRKKFKYNHFGYGSLHELIVLDKINSSGYADQIISEKKIKKKDQSILYSNSMSNINTQMINNMIQLNIKDEDEINQIDLKIMADTALIKNIQFSGNIFLEINCKELKQIFYSNLRIYKILDVDGFTITAFYADSQKFRINLNQSITNKNFQTKFVLQQSINSRNYKNQGFKFSGKIYKQNQFQWLDTNFWFSQIKYNQSDVDKKEDRQNINFTNFINKTIGVRKGTSMKQN